MGSVSEQVQQSAETMEESGPAEKLAMPAVNAPYRRRCRKFTNQPHALR